MEADTSGGIDYPKRRITYKELISGMKGGYRYAQKQKCSSIDLISRDAC